MLNYPHELLERVHAYLRTEIVVALCSSIEEKTRRRELLERIDDGQRETGITMMLDELAGPDYDD